MNLIKKIKCQFKRCIEPNDINKNQLEELVKQGCILIDVRSKQEFEEGHFVACWNYIESTSTSCTEVQR